MSYNSGYGRSVGCIYVQIGWRNSRSFKFGESFDRKLSTRFLHLRSHSFRLRYASGSSHFCDRFTFVEVNPSAVHWDIVDVAPETEATRQATTSRRNKRTRGFALFLKCLFRIITHCFPQILVYILTVPWAKLVLNFNNCRPYSGWRDKWKPPLAGGTRSGNPG